MTAFDPVPAPAPARRRSHLAADVQQRVLAPYKPHCRYVHRAEFSAPVDRRPVRADDPASWLRIDGACGIPEPCYIDATGHFNAVEFNIVYNQLLYLCLAETVRQRLLPALAGWDLDEFFRRQLPDVLIADYHVRFFRPQQSARFDAWMAITEVEPRPHKQMVLLQTRCGASAAAGGRSEGEVTIALVNWQPA
jgi:hypothetical protein